MVCLDVDNYENAYKRILGGAAKAAQEGAGACTVLMLVADDPDAICAARILAWLLKQDNIAYKTVPIANYDDISRINEETIEKSTEVCPLSIVPAPGSVSVCALKTVVMLNCGSRIDFNDYLSMHDDMVAIVVDSHRPFNLYNIFYNEKVLHLDDGDISALDEVKEAFEAL
ncbi:DNA replication initiation factor cdc45, partial [Spiromyces aspiralis]